MQLGHAQRRLLARCSLRYYSISAVSGKKSVSTPDAVAASGTSAAPRTRRPLASSFGGISIQNVAVPAQSQGFRSNRTNRPSRADDPKSSNAPRSDNQERQRANGRPAGSSRSDWGDGLVSLSFSSRLRILQKKKLAPQNTAALPEDQARRQTRHHAQTQGRQHDKDTESHPPRTHDRQHQNSSRTAQTQGRDNDQGAESHPPRTRDRDRQNSSRTSPTQARYNAQSAESYPPRDRDRQNSVRGGQMRGRQHEQGTESYTPRDRNRNRDQDRQNSTRGATQTSRQQQPTSAGDDKAKARAASSKMTRPPRTSHSQAQAQAQAKKPTSGPAPSSTTMKARVAQLTVLSSTNLDALLQTRSTPIAGTPSTTYTTLAEHLLREREHRTGDYSRYLPPHVGVRKNASCPSVLSTAQLALARQRDVALEQRDFALSIIDGLAQPRRQVRA